MLADADGVPPKRSDEAHLFAVLVEPPHGVVAGGILLGDQEAELCAHAILQITSDE